MTETRIGRLLAAGLHEAIVEELPQRLDFYEMWLRSDGLRDGTIGPAPMAAVLGFLRTEREYDQVVAAAGRLAASWTIASMGTFQRRAIESLPRPIRARVVLRLAAGIVRRTCTTTRALARMSRGSGTLDVRASVFCTVREPWRVPLCGFHAAVATETLAIFGFPARAQVTQCRAVAGSSCVIAVHLAGTDVATGPAMAA